MRDINKIVEEDIERLERNIRIIRAHAADEDFDSVVYRDAWQTIAQISIKHFERRTRRSGDAVPYKT